MFALVPPWYISMATIHFPTEVSFIREKIALPNSKVHKFQGSQMIVEVDQSLSHCSVDPFVSMFYIKVAYWSHVCIMQILYFTKILPKGCILYNWYVEL